MIITIIHMPSIPNTETKLLDLTANLTVTLLDKAVMYFTILMKALSTTLWMIDSTLQVPAMSRLFYVLNNIHD